MPVLLSYRNPVYWFAVQINWLVFIWGQHWHLMGLREVFFSLKWRLKPKKRNSRNFEWFSSLIITSSSLSNESALEKILEIPNSVFKRFLKYVWPFFNIMQESFKWKLKPVFLFSSSLESAYFSLITENKILIWN